MSYLFLFLQMASRKKEEEKKKKKKIDREKVGESWPEKLKKRKSENYPFFNSRSENVVVGDGGGEETCGEKMGLFGMTEIGV
jgi:hypothetical protein